MILDVNGNEVGTKLQKGDLLVFKPQRKTISIFRSNHRVIFSGDINEIPFPGDEDIFAYFANLLSNLVTTDQPLLEVEPDTFSRTVIDEEECITYFV